jgi:hypothetical protein
MNTTITWSRSVVDKKSVLQSRADILLCVLLMGKKGDTNEMRICVCHMSRLLHREHVAGWENLIPGVSLSWSTMYILWWARRETQTRWEYMYATWLDRRACGGIGRIWSRVYFCGEVRPIGTHGLRGYWICKRCYVSYIQHIENMWGIGRIWCLCTFVI